MKIILKIGFFIILVVAQDQQCMDRCGAETDHCHYECEQAWEETHCNEECYYYMCRCFKTCGCPECCDWEEFYEREQQEDPVRIKSNKIYFSDQTFKKSQKSE